jgi:hypothetical protein
MPNSRTNNNNSETRSESLAPPLMDVNGSCSSNGIDITFYVSYLKGIQPALLSCADCPAGGQSAQDSEGGGIPLRYLK